METEEPSAGTLGPRIETPSRILSYVPRGFAEIPPVLLTDSDGAPFEHVTRVQVVRLVGAVHLFDRFETTRYVAHFACLDFSGKVIPRFWPVRCTCDPDGKARRRGACRRWKPKGARSAMARDATVAKGTLLTAHEKIDPRLFCPNRVFLAEVRVVRTGQQKDPVTNKPQELPRACWYSRLGRLVGVDAGSLLCS